MKEIMKVAFQGKEYEFTCKNTYAEALKAIAIIESDIPEEEKSEKLVSLLWIVNHHDSDGSNSKLAGLNSMSTCVCDNATCIARIKAGDTICAHCYADAMQRRFKGLAEHNIINGWILRNVEIRPEDFRKAFPFIGIQRFFRIESFGDVGNVLQVKNYFNLCNAFPGTQFVAWSKNHSFYARAIEEAGKPENLIYIASSLRVNNPDLQLLDKFSFIDKLFTVYSKDYARENGIEINCGGRKCYECIFAGKNCYHKNGAKIINELLK